MDKAIHAARILGGNVLGGVKILHFTGDLRGHGTGIEMGDFSDPRFPRDNVLPGSGNPDPDWGDNPQSGNDNSTFRQTDSAG
jgi:hypothetical protein